LQEPPTEQPSPSSEPPLQVPENGSSVTSRRDEAKDAESADSQEKAGDGPSRGNSTDRAAGDGGRGPAGNGDGRTPLATDDSVPPQPGGSWGDLGVRLVDPGAPVEEPLSGTEIDAPPSGKEADQPPAVEAPAADTGSSPVGRPSAGQEWQHLAEPPVAEEWLDFGNPLSPAAPPGASASDDTKPPATPLDGPPVSATEAAVDQDGASVAPPAGAEAPVVVEPEKEVEPEKPAEPERPAPQEKPAVQEEEAQQAGQAETSSSAADTSTGTTTETDASRSSSPTEGQGAESAAAEADAHLVVSSRTGRPVVPSVKHPDEAKLRSGFTRAELRRSRQAAAPEMHRSRFYVGLVVLVVLALVVAAAVLAVRARLSAGAPAATVHATLPASVTVPGTAPTAIPWPASGQSAVAIPTVGYAQQSGPESPAPVASLTKIMTAFIVLHDHPLPNGDNGPTITMSATDVNFFNNAASSGQSDMPVSQGEALTERQLLEGMLVRSANNLAETLANWDAGSVSAFVAKMNATAKFLGMTQTNFVDPSGDNPGSVSTPADVLKVTGLAMALPAFAQTVSMTSLTFPEAGTLDSYTPDLGSGGVVGVKSGFTSEAGECDVMAVVHYVGLVPVVVLAAVTGQSGDLDSVGSQALAIANAVAPGVVYLPVAARDAHVATATVDGSSTSIVTATPAGVLGWPGEKVSQQVVVTRSPTAGSPAHTVVGVARYDTGNQRVVAFLETTNALPKANVFQRLF
jgi:serine-type D-Ala-D-Ala carboxypeptidase (penicillin-binding protein 5/6)